ncbi:MAG: PilZ domain-containing protein [Planctomycetota bacterium]
MCDTLVDVSTTSDHASGERYLLECIRCNNSHVKAFAKAEERRRHPRAPLRQIVQVSQAAPDSSQTYGVMGSTADVSQGGLRLEAQQSFAEGSLIALSFAMGERIVEAVAEVVYSAATNDGLFRMGVRFTGMSSVDRIFIEKYCYLRSHLA